MSERVEEIRLDREGIAHFLNEQHQGWHDGMGSLSQTRVYGTALLLADAVRADLARVQAALEKAETFAREIAKGSVRDDHRRQAWAIIIEARVALEGR